MITREDILVLIGRHPEVFILGWAIGLLTGIDIGATLARMAL